MTASAQAVYNAKPSHEDTRHLPASITIPVVRGEMVIMRPSTIDDLPLMDQLDAYYHASAVTGKDRVAERAALHAWVERSVSWSKGISDANIRDSQFRRTIAWTLCKVPEDAVDTAVTEENATEVIGMVFLIDIDAWARSARIQVVLGREFRGRGYSRDAMPRIMTYGFAHHGDGLNLHRIWVSVPEKNQRAISVYQSLGFVKSGEARDALWDERNGKYQNLIVMDTLEDEYDPVRSLDVFGMHYILGNPGIEEALKRHEQSERELNTQMFNQPARNDECRDNEESWPYNTEERKSSNKAWWRTLGTQRNERRTSMMNDD
ncbi:GNAT family acetyltransferase [Bifidobacterium dolichotidis]|uniref:GNAT family acetyltransferase n=1 Tax=Bifidobacterium dolichotidis TaxID=2306976 RepID=A0A430FRJ2_9BIFI|nr:GNAT family N-acetyltransferase [Bifidobacterium dolichotidis]RSX55465.1 GNAT family acetyltransferase [Bifidobacterium dolichotidis]